MINQQRHHHSMHFIDKSSISTEESRNETDSVKIPHLQLPSKQIINSVHHTSKSSKIKKMIGLRINFLTLSMTGFYLHSDLINEL